MAAKKDYTLLDAEMDLDEIECGLAALFMFEDAFSNGASDHTARLEKALEPVLSNMHEAAARLRKYIDASASKSHEPRS